jgi:hypothetical protein
LVVDGRLRDGSIIPIEGSSGGGLRTKERDFDQFVLEALIARGR